jgi:hypothetical protein
MVEEWVRNGWGRGSGWWCQWIGPMSTYVFTRSAQVMTAAMFNNNPFAAMLAWLLQTAQVPADARNSPHKQTTPR